MARRLTLLFLLGFAFAQAQPAAPAPKPAEGDGGESRPVLSRISGVFDDLPQFDVPGTFKILLRPHFGDLTRRDYMRTETGLRWALNEKFDISAEASVYFTHGLGDSGDGYGIGKVRLGSRYLINDWPRAGYDTSMALTMDAPVGSPPFDMTDGQYHLTPSFIVQRKLPQYHRITAFAGLGLDLIDASDIPGRFGTNQPHEDSVNGTVGLIYDLGQLKYTFAATYATTAGISDATDHFFYLQPGVQWYVPRKLTFNSKTQWIASFGIRTSWGPDGTDISFRTRVRAEITFRQWMRNIRDRNKAKERVEQAEEGSAR
jgi:hypothetical protein